MLFIIKKENEEELVSTENYSMVFNEEANFISLKINNFIYYLDVVNNQLKDNWLRFSNLLIEKYPSLEFDCNCLSTKENFATKFSLNQIYNKESTNLKVILNEKVREDGLIYVSEIIKSYENMYPQTFTFKEGHNPTIQKGKTSKTLSELMQHLKLKEEIGLETMKFEVAIVDKEYPIPHLVYKHKNSEIIFDLDNEINKLKEDFAYIKQIKISDIKDIKLATDTVE